MRTPLEKDTLGLIHVPKGQLWGAQTQRSLQNFRISKETMPWPLINALVKLKQISADEILSGKRQSEFLLSVWQIGSGTQKNMNVNEVIANLASELLGGSRVQEHLVHPNDHVNHDQSSNDIFRTAMHLASIMELDGKLIPVLDSLKNSLIEKSNIFSNIVKIGRTHLQDATPLTLGQEFSGYAAQLKISKEQVVASIPGLLQLVIGSTAVGTGLNTHPFFGDKVVEILSKETGKKFICASNKFQGLASHEALLFAHGALKSLAAILMKIANDIRWLSSGPRSGLGEISIPENEPESSIMRGKVNPNQCEAITMISAQVVGNDVAIIGWAIGNLEFNVFKLLIIYNFLQSAQLLIDRMSSFNQYCVAGIEPKEKRISELLNCSLMLATALNSYISYDKTVKIAKKAYKEGLSLKEANSFLGYVTEEDFSKWTDPCMTNAN